MRADNSSMAISSARRRQSFTYGPGPVAAGPGVGVATAAEPYCCHIDDAFSAANAQRFKPFELPPSFPAGSVHCSFFAAVPSPEACTQRRVKKSIVDELRSDLRLSRLI